MNEEKGLDAKKSLMNSLENIHQKEKKMKDLSNLSYLLLKKFTNPFSEPEIPNGDEGKMSEP